MPNNSVGRTLPEVPQGALRLLLGEPDDEVDENYRTDVGPKRVATWFPDQIEDLPLVYFAAIHTIKEADWLIRGELEPVESRSVISLRRVAVEPWGHEGEVSTAVMKKIPYAQIRERALDRMRALGARPIHRTSGGETDEDWWPDFPAETPMYAAHVAVEQASRRGRPRLNDEIVRQTAVWYLEELVADTGPIRAALVDRFRDSRLVGLTPTEATVRDWVHKARQRGYLTGVSSRGIAGGSVGPTLVAELSDARRRHGRDDDPIGAIANEFGAAPSSIREWLKLARSADQ